jgi:hypothetical protein
VKVSVILVLVRVLFAMVCYKLTLFATGCGLQRYARVVYVS